MASRQGIIKGEMGCSRDGWDGHRAINPWASLAPRGSQINGDTGASDA